MGFWSFSFGENVRVEDEYFGGLRFSDFKNFKDNYFEGERIFAPRRKEVGLSITGSLPGPTIAQQEFYQQIEENYHTFIPGIQELITDEVRNWKPDFTIRDFTQECWPVYLSIPAIEKQEQELEWEIVFKTFHDQNHTFTIYMRGFFPYHVHMDG